MYLISSINDAASSAVAKQKEDTASIQPPKKCCCGAEVFPGLNFHGFPTVSALMEMTLIISSSEIKRGISETEATGKVVLYHGNRHGCKTHGDKGSVGNGNIIPLFCSPDAVPGQGGELGPARELPSDSLISVGEFLPHSASQDGGEEGICPPLPHWAPAFW